MNLFHIYDLKWNYVGCYWLTYSHGWTQGQFKPSFQRGQAVYLKYMGKQFSNLEPKKAA